VVLDDDDELVIGKSPSMSSSCSSLTLSQTLSKSPKNKRTKKDKSKSKKTQQNGDSCNATPKSKVNNSRPMINTQKLAQRLNNIVSEQDGGSRRSRSPRETPERRNTPEKPFTTASHIPAGNTKPHAVIAKPVERRRKKRKVRPEPEGAPLSHEEMEKWEQIIYNDEPIFSDYGTDEDQENVPARPARRSGLSIAAFAIGMGVNSNTMIKYAIIGTELQNITRVSIPMVRIHNHFTNSSFQTKALIHYHHPSPHTFIIMRLYWPSLSRSFTHTPCVIVQHIKILSFVGSNL